MYVWAEVPLLKEHLVVYKVGLEAADVHFTEELCDDRWPALAGVMAILPKMAESPMLAAVDK